MITDTHGQSAAYASSAVTSTSIGSQLDAYTYRTIGLREIRDYTQHLTGRIKTIVDAAIPDPKQNKAVKDLVHDALWTEHYDAVRQWAEIATERHMIGSATEATQCIPAFPFATDHSVPMSI